LSGVVKNGSDIDVGITFGYFVLAAEAMGYGTHVFGQPPNRPGAAASRLCKVWHS